MINPFITSELAHAHRSDLLKEAETARLAKEARTDRPGLGSRMLNSMQSILFALRRRVAGRLDTTEAGRAAPNTVIFGDR
jgi:hypothetical protein